MFKDCYDYWKVVVKDAIENSNLQIELSEKDISRIAEKCLNDDNLWSIIEETIYDYALGYKD